jgi:hypothetical protein
MIISPYDTNSIGVFEQTDVALKLYAKLPGAVRIESTAFEFLLDVYPGDVHGGAMEFERKRIKAYGIIGVHIAFVRCGLRKGLYLLLRLGIHVAHRTAARWSDEIAQTRYCLGGSLARSISSYRASHGRVALVGASTVVSFCGVRGL